jgi:hypothetical protein
MVSVFGSIFNDLEVIKTDSAGKVLKKIKVPLAYGPRQKFLSRIKDLNDPKMAIKLPRISFEIVDMSYDGAARLNRNKKLTSTVSGDVTALKTLRSPAVYKTTFELNIMSKTQDDALQILEQILPMFQPDYTVTITDIPDMSIKSDVPIVLNGIALNDEYEGDFLSRRTIIYTLTFETRIKYYTGIQNKEIINKTEVYYKDNDSTENIEVQKVDGTTTPYTETIDFFNEP